MGRETIRVYQVKPFQSTYVQTYFTTPENDVMSWLSGDDGDQLVRPTGVLGCVRIVDQYRLQVNRKFAVGEVVGISRERRSDSGSLTRVERELGPLTVSATMTLQAYKGLLDSYDGVVRARVRDVIAKLRNDEELEKVWQLLRESQEVVVRKRRKVKSG